MSIIWGSQNFSNFKMFGEIYSHIVYFSHSIFQFRESTKCLNLDRPKAYGLSFIKENRIYYQKYFLKVFDKTLFQKDEEKSFHKHISFLNLFKDERVGNEPKVNLLVGKYHYTSFQ